MAAGRSCLSCPHQERHRQEGDVSRFSTRGSLGNSSSSRNEVCKRSSCLIRGIAEVPGSLDENVLSCPPSLGFCVWGASPLQDMC